ncbi:MAG: hypothetical protein ACRDHF_15105 [Tepidiformaceae bacterium]
MQVQTTLYVATPSAANREFPSLLGWDVLRHFDLAISWDRRAVTLERV